MDRRLFSIAIILCLTLGFGAGCAKNRLGCLGGSCGGSSCGGVTCGTSATAYPTAAPVGSIAAPSYTTTPSNGPSSTYDSYSAPSDVGISGSGSR